MTKAGWPARPLLLLPGAFGAIGGIQTYNRLTVKAIDERIGAWQGSCETLVLNDPESALANHRGALQNVRLRGFDGSRVRFALAAMSLARRTRPDLVVIGHVNFAPLGLALALLRPRAPQLFLTHGVDAWMRFSWPWRSALKRADLVLSVSEHTRARLASLNGIAEERTAVLPGVVDPEWAQAFARLADAPFPARPVLLTVSRLDAGDRYKGIDLVLRALPRISESVRDVRYVVIGDGTDRPRLEQIAREMRVADLVEFRGWATDAELARAYSECSLFVLPSTGEGFGIVYIEAGFFGRASLAARAGGAPEVVEDGVTGCLVDAGDDEAISRNVVALLSDPERLLALGRRARVRMLERFTYEQFASRLAGCLEEARSRRPRHKR
jgi:glycosyltransferase involved in cell wall biosynthesis